LSQGVTNLNISLRIRGKGNDRIRVKGWIYNGEVR